MHVTTLGAVLTWVEAAVLIYAVWRVVPAWRRPDRQKRLRRASAGLLAVGSGTNLLNTVGLLGRHDIPLDITQVLALSFASVLFFAPAPLGRLGGRAHG